MIDKLIREVMAAKGLTQQDLADLIGASLSRVKAITSGRVAKLKPDEIKALIEELHVSADWLATGAGPMFRPPKTEDQDDFAQRIQAVSAMGAGGLKPDEAALLDNYRHASPEGKKAIKATSDALAQPEKGRKAAG